METIFKQNKNKCGIRPAWKHNYCKIFARQAEKQFGIVRRKQQQTRGPSRNNPVQRTERKKIAEKWTKLRELWSSPLYMFLQSWKEW